MTFKPMLAADAALDRIDIGALGIYCSPKLDGIRCLGINGVAMSRSMKPLPNRYVQSLFATGQFDGFDGELIVGDPTAPDAYRKTSSAVMSIEGQPNVTYHVFDCWDMDDAFHVRNKEIGKRIYTRNCATNLLNVVKQTVVVCETGLSFYESDMITQGYEGVMIRDVLGPYKHGRSTVNEGYLLKLKRFTDDEFEIIGFEERMQNTNEATTNELGNTHRSSAKAGMVGRGDLGAIVLKHPAGTFTCGTGFSDSERQIIWDNQASYLGKLAKIKHFASGAKTMPRFPVWLGLRDNIDL